MNDSTKWPWPISTTINQEFDEKVRLLLAREDVNRKLIKGISQRVERLERGEAAPPPTDLIPARRPEEV